MTTPHEFGPRLKATPRAPRRSRSSRSPTRPRSGCRCWWRSSATTSHAGHRGSTGARSSAITPRPSTRPSRKCSPSSAPLSGTWSCDHRPRTRAHSGAADDAASTIPPRIRPRTMRIMAGLADGGVVVVLGLATAWSLAVDWSTAVAVAGCVYYPLTTRWLGRSPVLSLAAGNGAIHRAWQTAPGRATAMSVTRPVASEPVREESQAAVFQPRSPHRCRPSLRRPPAHEPGATPIARGSECGRALAA